MRYNTKKGFAMKEIDNIENYFSFSISFLETF